MSNDNSITLTTSDNNIKATDSTLLIVLDDDDGDNDCNYNDQYDFFYLPPTPISKKDKSINKKKNHSVISFEDCSAKKVNIEIKNLLECSSSKSILFSSGKLPMNISSVQEKAPQRVKTIVQRKKLLNTTSTTNNKNTSMVDLNHGSSIISRISFDGSTNILTIARVGSIYYCIEDLYLKVFSSLCTFNEFTYLLEKTDKNVLKNVTLSEKISIEQQNSNLKEINSGRYHLLSINAFDYIMKLKTLLKKYVKQMDEILKELSSLKQTVPTSTSTDHKIISKLLLSKHMETDTDKQSKSIQHSTHERELESNSNTNAEALPTFTLRNSQHEFQSEQISNNNLPSNKYQMQDNKMSQSSTRPEDSNRFSNDNYSMPLIVNVEGNVNTNDLNTQRSEKSLTYRERLLTNRPYPSPYLYSYGHSLSTPVCVQISNEPYYQNTRTTTPSSYDKPNESVPHRSPNMILSAQPSQHIQQDQINSSHLLSNGMQLARKQNFNPPITFERQIDIQTCRLPCCCSRFQTDKPPTLDNLSSNERMTYPQYVNSTVSQTHPPATLKNAHVLTSANRKQRLIRSNPYPSVKPSFTQACLPRENSFNKETQNKTDVYHTIPSTVIQNSTPTIISPPHTPHEYMLPTANTTSIDIAQAIIEHRETDMDQIPKLVVRHTKTYSKKKLDTMGQLFPTWFTEPDYRCIHCFTCDQVFTPQKFMTHVDDEQLRNLKPLNMTSIELLTSEKLSETKVGLWNDFCINLSNHARKGRIPGFLINENV